MNTTCHVLRGILIFIQDDPSTKVSQVPREPKNDHKIVQSIFFLYERILQEYNNTLSVNNLLIYPV